MKALEMSLKNVFSAGPEEAVVQIRGFRTVPSDKLIEFEAKLEGEVVGFTLKEEVTSGLSNILIDTEDVQFDGAIVSFPWTALECSIGAALKDFGVQTVDVVENSLNIKDIKRQTLLGSH